MKKQLRLSLSLLLLISGAMAQSTYNRAIGLKAGGGISITYKKSEVLIITSKHKPPYGIKALE